MFTISYIIATKNRLSFLKILFSQLLPGLQPDEEIVVIDGQSNDGSVAFLEALLKDGKIHQFISEPDRNQAEAWNKGMLMARGTIIKKLIDDDVHDFAAIRTCRDFMLQNPRIDACISNTLETNLTHPDAISHSGRLPWFMDWKAGKVPSFSFGDVYLLLRRSSLSFIGVYDTTFKMIDWEYSLRMSYLGTNIAYYTGCNSMSVSTPGNVTSTATKQLLKREEKIGMLKYDYAGDKAGISKYSRLKIAVGTLLASGDSNKRTAVQIHNEAALTKIYAGFYDKLRGYNAANSNWAFITNA